VNFNWLKRKKKPIIEQDEWWEHGEMPIIPKNEPEPESETQKMFDEIIKRLERIENKIKKLKG
jgi:cell fate regulator YaaT (PSP1 superfamily)